MKMTIAICDLNAAVAAKEDTTRNHTKKCLMAQFAFRIVGKPVVGSTNTAAAFNSPKRDEDYNFRVYGAEELVNAFDQDDISWIRERLPLDVEVNYQQ